MTQGEINLCLDIARCNCVGKNSCKKIYSVQKNCNPKHVPEPWNGHLSSAKIMYVSSNPSIDCREYFPHNHCLDKCICDFFDNRFYNGKIITHQKEVSVQFWTYLIKYSNWINDCLKKNPPIPQKIQKNKGKHFYSDLNDFIVSTEIVHCKSKKEFGVAQCKQHCFDKWMKQITQNFTGNYIVILGSQAQKYCNAIINIVNSLPLPQKNINVINLPHPKARMKDKNRQLLVYSELQKIGLVP